MPAAREDGDTRDGNYNRSHSPIPASTAAALKSMHPSMAHPLARMRTVLLLLFFGVLAVAAQGPEVKVNHFKNQPARIFYFDDTTVSISPVFSPRDGTCMALHACYCLGSELDWLGDARSSFGLDASLPFLILPPRNSPCCTTTARPSQYTAQTMKGGIGKRSKPSVAKL